MSAKIRSLPGLNSCPFCGSAEIETIYAGKFWREYRCNDPAHMSEHGPSTFGTGDMIKENEYRKSLGIHV